jgi:hypothetical protein
VLAMCYLLSIMKKLTISLILATLTVWLTTSCSNSTESSESQVSVCESLSEVVSQFEDSSSIISFNPEASPNSLELFGLADRLVEAGIPNASGTDDNYTAVEDFLAVAEECLSEDAKQYLSNYLS